MQKLSSILLVDDDDTTNFLNGHLLKKLGVTDEVLVARNGQEALDVLAQHCTPPATTCPVLVLLDVNMPVMGGLDFLEAYQPQPPVVPIRVAILTSSVHPHDLKRLQLLPHIALLHKPLTQDKIEALLREHFHRQLPRPV
jgi:CheY-like chemotaxis protein